MGRSAQIGKILGLAVVILHTDPVIDPVGDQCPQFLLIAADVSAVGHHDGQMLRLYAAFVDEIVNEMGNHQILPHPESGHVTDHQRHPISGADPLAQRRAVDGLLQRGEQGRTDVADGRRLCSMQFRQNIRFVQGKGHRPMSIFKVVGFHKQPPMKTHE